MRWTHRARSFTAAVIFAGGVVLASPHQAIARQDEDEVHYDARVQGYEPNMELKSSTTGLAWATLMGMTVVCVAVMFKDAKRSHLD